MKAGRADGELVSVRVWRLVIRAQCGRREGPSRGQLTACSGMTVVTWEDRARPGGPGSWVLDWRRAIGGLGGEEGLGRK